MVEITTLVLGSIVIGLVEVSKRMGMPLRFLPLVSVLLGVGLSFLAFGTLNAQQVILNGLMIGLTAVGLFSSVKNTAGK